MDTKLRKDNLQRKNWIGCVKLSAQQFLSAIDASHFFRVALKRADTSVFVESTHGSIRTTSKYHFVIVLAMPQCDSKDSYILVFVSVGSNKFSCLPIVFSRNAVGTVHLVDERSAGRQLQRGITTNVIVKDIGAVSGL